MMHVTSHSFPIDKRQSSDQKGLVWIIKLFWSSWRKFKDWIQIESKDSRILGMISVYHQLYICMLVHRANDIYMILQPIT